MASKSIRGEFSDGVEYPAANAEIAGFERRLKIDQDLKQMLKKVAKTLKTEI
jgi:hypothetical protein